MKCIEYMESLGYTYVNRKTGKPKTSRKMKNFRIFCELLAKMMLKAIDFTDVVEVYRRNEKPEKLGIATCSSNRIPPSINGVEMKSPSR